MYFLGDPPFCSLLYLIYFFGFAGSTCEVFLGSAHFSIEVSTANTLAYVTKISSHYYCNSF